MIYGPKHEIQVAKFKALGASALLIELRPCNLKLVALRPYLGLAVTGLFVKRPPARKTTPRRI